MNKSTDPTSTPQPTALLFQDEEGKQHRLDTGPEGMIVADGYLHLQIGSNPQEWAAFPILSSSTFLLIREVLTGRKSLPERTKGPQPYGLVVLLDGDKRQRLEAFPPDMRLKDGEIYLSAKPHGNGVVRIPLSAQRNVPPEKPTNG